MDVFRRDAQHLGLLACGFQFFALTKVSGEGDHFAAILGLQPFQDDRGIKATGIGQNNFLRRLLRCGIGRNHRFPFHERIARRLYVFKGKSKDHRACSAWKRAAQWTALRNFMRCGGSDHSPRLPCSSSMAASSSEMSRPLVSSRSAACWSSAAVAAAAAAAAASSSRRASSSS